MRKFPIDNMLPKDTWLTLAEVRAASGLSIVSLRKQAKDGRYVCRRFKNTLYIESNSFNAFISTPAFDKTGL